MCWLNNSNMFLFYRKSLMIAIMRFVFYSPGKKKAAEIENILMGRLYCATSR